MPMSIENGAGVDAVEADARAVGCGGEVLGAVAAVDLDGVGAVAALVEVGVVTRVPDHPVVAALAEDLVVGVAAGERVVVGAAEQEVDAALAEQRVVAGLAEQLVGPEPPVRTSLPAPPNRFALGSAPLASLSVIVSLPPAEDLDQRRVGHRRRAAATATAPPLTRILPAASRLMVIVLSAPSPKTLSVPLANVAVTAALAGKPETANIPTASAKPTSRRRALRTLVLTTLVVDVDMVPLR